MKKGIGPRGLGAPKQNRAVDVKTMAHKTTNLPEVTVVGKKGKGLKETTEIGKGYSGEDYSAERKRLTKEAKNAFNTKNNRAPGSPIGGADMSAIRDGVRTTLSTTGYTERGVRKKSDNTRLTSEQEGQYRRRVNPGNMAKTPAKQTKKTVGGKSLKEVDSAADVPKSTSFGGTNYNLGAQTGSGPHYFNEGYSSKHGKKGTIKRPGDAGVYHVSREVVKPIKGIKPKKAKIR